MVAGSAGNILVLGEQSLVKLDASGAELWCRTFSGTPATIRGLTTYRDDPIALVGDFTGTADFDTGPLTAAGQDGFVTVLAPWRTRGRLRRGWSAAARSRLGDPDDAPGGG